MKKIIIGYEQFDRLSGKKWNFNGRADLLNLRADVSSENEYDFPENATEFLKHNYRLLITPHIGSVDDYSRIFSNIGGEQLHEIKIVSEISNEVYFYPIEIRNASIYTNYTNFIKISDKALTDIKNKQAYLIFIYDNEGDIIHTLPKFSKLIADLNLPKEMVYLVHGDFSTEKFSNQPFLYEPVNMFPWWLEGSKNLCLSPVKYIPNKLYSSYNRIIRPHRVLMLSILYNNDLIKDGIVSFGTDGVPIKNHQFSEYISEDALEFLIKFSGTSPDEKNLSTDNPANDITLNHYIYTFVSLISETLGDIDNTMFFSEKIYKPIVVGHPFLLLGGVGQLAKLREFGFKTFSNWWDESYDTMPTAVARANKISEILLDLNKKSQKELIQIREEMLPVLAHNQAVFRKIVDDTPYGNHTPIFEVMQKILQTRK